MLTWKIPLGFPPQISMMGHAQHGIQAVETFRLPRLWCAHFYEYEAELRIHGHRLRIRPGYASVIPPDTEMEYHYQGVAPHLYVHFSLPSGGRHDLVPIPVIQGLGEDFAALYRLFADIPRWLPTQPRRAAARLWDVLWRLTDPPAATGAPLPAVEQVRELVEIHLAEPLYVSQLASQVGFSQNHLARLFRARMGVTVVDYIRQRRVERARHLLQHTTLPIKAIAAEVGIPDLHLFNKIIRHALGRAPRQIRAIA